MLAILLLSACLTMAQTPGNRTTNTIVADVLAQIPVQKQANYNQLMGDLYSTGEDGVRQLVQQMNAPGKGSNSSVEYALSGLTRYVTGLNDEQARVSLSKSYAKVLAETQEERARVFIINQLQIVGGDEIIESLAGLLSVEPYSEPASMALAAMGTDLAGETLRSALLRKMGTPKTQKDVIIALGEMKAKGVEELLLGQVGIGDEDMQKSVLYALSRLGTTASIDKMKQAAEKTNYTSEKSGATDAYVKLIKRLAVDESSKKVVKAAEDILKKTTKSSRAEVRIAAFEILMNAEKDQKKRLKLLANSLKDNDVAYRNSALASFSPYANESSYIEVLKLAQKAKSDARVDILKWIGREAVCPEKRDILQKLEVKFDRTLIAELTSYLKDGNYSVKEAAAWAMVKIGNKEYVPVLAELLKSTDAQTIELAKSTLTSFSADITPDVAKVIPEAQDAGKIAGVNLLALRKSDAYINSAYDLIKNGSSEVRKAAYESLPALASEKDFATLSGMLEMADEDAVKPLQKAVIQAATRAEASKRTNMIVRRFMQAQDAKRFLFYPVLASTKDKQALDIITKGFTEGNKVASDAAFDALLQWSGFEVADILYAIAADQSKSSYFDKALNAYIRIVSSPSLSGENRLIFLRKAMDIAKTPEQKKNIMNNIQRTGTFTALVYSGKFLDDKAVQQEAAQSVMNIALNNKTFTGPVVSDLLEKVIAVLNNPDADYQKQAIRKHLSEAPETEGFVSMFNGNDLTGWKGLVENPIARAKMSASQLKAAQQKADERMLRDWQVENGLLLFDGTGFDNLCSEKDYGDFELYIDWMLDPAGPEADAGLYLRGTPQVQIWDTSRVNVGAQVGSGGLYNNQVHQSKPLKVADNKLGEWNTFYVKMVGDRVTVYLNGELVTDNVVLENFWDRSKPIPAVEQLELQAHGSKVYYRDIYIKELPRIEPYKLSKEEEKEGFRMLFDGTNMHEWTGDLNSYRMEDGCISVTPSKSFGGNLYTKDEFADFVFRFEFQLTPGANNGVGIRTPMEGDAAYQGMEIQILDDRHPIYKNITPLQVHGSVYGIIGAKRDALKPVGEWNVEEIYAKGNHIRVTVNGVVIVDGDLKEATKNGTADGQKHPGLFNKSGHIGFLGHGSPLKFRNIRVKELK